SISYHYWHCHPASRRKHCLAADALMAVWVLVPYGEAVHYSEDRFIPSHSGRDEVSRLWLGIMESSHTACAWGGKDPNRPVPTVSYRERHFRSCGCCGARLCRLYRQLESWRTVVLACARRRRCPLRDDAAEP